MARVNTGLLQFSVNKYTTVEDMSRMVLKLTNSNPVVNKKLGQIFAKSGRYRMQALPDAKGKDVTITSETYLSKIKLSNLKSQWIMTNILRNISTYPKYNTKGTILIYFINQGLHITFRDVFHLDEVPDYMSTDLSPTLVNNIMADNTKLNEVINSIYNDTDSITQKYWNDFYTNIAPLCIDDGSLESIKSLGYRIGDINSSDSWDTITMLSQYVKEDKFNEFNELFKELRNNLKIYQNPPLQELCNKFVVSISTYKRQKFDALNTLVTTFGTELCQEVIK